MTTSAQSGNRTVAQRYRLDKVVGRGAMGAVWQAEDTVLHRTVALKEVILPPGLSREDRAVACERTFREARAIARLAHPNVVTLYDVVEEDKRPWVVMELVPARSLAQVLKDDGPLESTKAAKVGLAVLGALQAAHEAGITHRDVKPGNIMVGDDDRVKLTDFGIARAAGDMTLTGTGLLVGSPSYMAPEVVRGEELRPTADLFGLGATLYCAVEGHPPFSGGDALSTLNAVVAEPPKPYKRAGALRPVLDGLLEKDPRTRLSAPRARQMLLEAVRDNTPGASAASGTMRRDHTRGALTAPAGPPGMGPRPEHTQAIPGGPPGRGGWQQGPGPQQRPPTPPSFLPTGEANNRYDDVFAPQRGRTKSSSGSTAGRNGKVVAAVVLCIALIIGGVILSRSMMGGNDSSPTNTAQNDGTKDQPGPGDVPDGFEKYSDPDGRFTAAVPKGWTQHKQRNAMEFQDGDGENGRFMRLYSFGGSDAESAFSEPSFSRNHDEYTKVRLDKTSFHDMPGAEWEFTYSRNGELRHVVWKGFVSDGRVYGVYLSTPDDKFGASKDLFDTALQTFALS